MNSLLRRIADRYAGRIDETLLDRFAALTVRNTSEGPRLLGIGAPDPARFSELRGIDRIIAELRRNTEQFLQGLPCNNVLLYGPRGTGKSSAVKALLNAYRRQGLRMIEMPQETLRSIDEITEIVRRRREPFIIFCDDLSFGADETVFRRMKAILEGGLEARPRNMIICATSNRRHLMPEQADDNLPRLVGRELQPAETVEANLSLSDRFGLRLGFEQFGPGEYLEIVRHAAAGRKIGLPGRSLDAEAMQWAADHGSFSGRTARQFIDQTEGRLKQGARKKRQGKKAQRP